MSRRQLRSHTSLHSVYASENAPVATKPASSSASSSGLASKPLRTRPGRRALSNITNNASAAPFGSKPASKIIKKRAVGTTRRVGVTRRAAAAKPVEVTESMEIDETISDSLHTMPLMPSASEYKISQVDPVDLPDMGDAQACAEYAADIMAHLKSIETRRAPSPTYMRQTQSDINPRMREILVDWLVEVHLKFKLRHETLFLTINLIDRFLAVVDVKRTQLQLVGCTGMLLASKFEEIYAPEVRDFVYISANAYTREQILDMEQDMLRALGFNLVHPSAFRFVERYAKIAGATEDEQFEWMAKYFCELTLQKYSCLAYRPSEIAAAAVFLTQKALNFGQWDNTMRNHTQFSKADLEECATEMLADIQNTEPKYKAVRRKYASRKYKQVSQIDCSGVIVM